MASYQTTGIILGRTNFGEADQVVRFLTADQGKVSAVAKGVRRAKSKAGGHLEPFGEVKLMLVAGRNMDVITSARLAWYPHSLVSDYRRLTLASMVVSLIDRLAPAGESQPLLYAHTREALAVIDSGEQGALVELWFKLRLLAITGLQPALDGCMVCDRSDEGDYWFEAERGGLTCNNCHSAVAAPMPTAAIKLWRLLLDYPYATIARIGGAAAMAETSLSLCDDFYDAHIGRSIRPNLQGTNP